MPVVNFPLFVDFILHSVSHPGPFFFEKPFFLPSESFIVSGHLSGSEKGKSKMRKELGVMGCARPVWCCCTLAILALGRQKLEDCKFGASLGLHIARLSNQNQKES